MSKTLLFCTANVPGKVIDELLEAATNPTVDCGDFRWSLVRTRDQAPLDDPTTAPVGDFETSFLNASIDEIGVYFNTRYTREFPDYPADWSSKSFAVLDERSIEDKTLLIVRWWQQDQSLEELQEIRDEWLIGRYKPTGWQSLRVTFEDSPQVGSSIELSPSAYLVDLQGPENFTDDGVLIMP
ncbi:hypothetical protein B0O99DRAFT_589164 [Bisporella sp. PMI_857]|nr:hypothetical protein B0O99DRAFT_589164 [Bisporella sp. PMI_857]